MPPTSDFEIYSPNMPLYSFDMVPSVSQEEGAGRDLDDPPHTINDPVIGFAILHDEKDASSEGKENNRYYAAVETISYWSCLARQRSSVFNSKQYTCQPVERDKTDLHDGTSFLPNQKDFRRGRNRARYAPICLQLNPTDDDFYKHRDEPVHKWIVCVDGVCRVLVDAFRQKPLNFFDLDIMPIRVSRKIEGFRYAQIVRWDCRITEQDFVQRMCPIYSKDEDGGWMRLGATDEELQRTRHAMKMRYWRFCAQGRLLRWSRKENAGITAIDRELKAELKIKDPNAEANNTTAALEYRLDPGPGSRERKSNRGSKRKSDASFSADDSDTIVVAPGSMKLLRRAENLGESLQSSDIDSVFVSTNMTYDTQSSGDKEDGFEEDGTGDEDDSLFGDD